VNEKLKEFVSTFWGLALLVHCKSDVAQNAIYEHADWLLGWILIFHTCRLSFPRDKVYQDQVEKVFRHGQRIKVLIGLLVYATTKE